MDEPPKIERFESSEALLADLRQRIDDIEEFVIPVQPGVTLTNRNDGHQIRQPGVGGILKVCNGHQLSLHREDAERLINDGILQRLKIKCRLDTLGEQ